MPTRENAPVGSPCWVDLWTSDVESSRKFYTELFGWEAQEPSPEFGGYFMFTLNGAFVAGGMGDMGDMRANNTWKVFLASEDVAKTVELAEAVGAQVVAPPMEIADLGAQAVLVDPTGAALGVWEARAFPGLTVLGESGTASWFELLTRDYKTAVDFYRSVFHWETKVVSDTDEFRYTVMQGPGSSDEMLAGIMDASGFLAEDRPAMWSVFFGVDDADVAVARIVELGGSIVRAPEDTPYGRLATAADPSGAQFKLVAPNQAMPARAS
jgi:uncharacterized protein